MLSVLSLLVFVVVAQAAPAIQHLNPTQQYLLLNPQLQQSIKFHQPLIQPIPQLGRIEVPKDQKQLLVYYPNTPLLQYDQPYSGAIRQNNENQDWLAIIAGFFFPRPMMMDPPVSAPTEETSDIIKTSKIELEDDAEVIPMQQTPASTVPLPERRIFVLNGQPQFFGNFDALANPANPVYSLQPIQAIKARSIESTPQENVESSALKSDTMNEHLGQIAALTPLAPGVPLKLRSGIDQPVQRDGSVEQDSLPAVISLERESFHQPRFQSDYPNALNQATDNADSLKEEPSKSDISITTYESNDPSVARASPSAIALAGIGGLATTSPVGTALAGKGGIAQSSPHATSVAGEFLDDSQDEKKEN